MVVGDNESTATKNAGKWMAISIAMDGNAAVQRGVYCPMEHIRGFTRRLWMPPSAECLRRIALAAAVVKEFELNTQNTSKTQLLASNYGRFRLLVVCEKFNPK
jgi:hypothetical protein